MTHSKLKINRPALTATWSPEQMRAAAVRIHNRFASLLSAIIESADWANYRLAQRPIEVGKPAFPDPGEFCDLVLQRRNGPSEVALEIKTRHVRYDDMRSPMEILDSVLDHMSAQLLALQKLANQNDALWCVALGLYRVPFQSAAIHYDTPFDVVMIWGRDIGRDSPSARARWSSLAELDRAMCSSLEISEFFSLQSIHRPTPQHEPRQRDIEELIKQSAISEKMKHTLLALRQFPKEPTGLRTFLREHSNETCSEFAMRHYALAMIDAGVVKGYAKGSKSHALRIDEQALINYLLQQAD